MKRRRITLPAAASLAVATLAVIALAASSVPLTMHIQGLLTDELGDPVASATLTLVFHIYSEETGGVLLWRESQSVNTDASGLWNAKLGAVTKLTHSVFADSSRWLEIVVGNKDTLSRVQLTTAPFSYRLSTVDGAAAGTLTGNLEVTGDLEVTGELAPLGGIVTASGITIQSTGSNVLVIAGTSRITVDPDGGVTIQSSAVTINSTGHLSLSADSTLALDAQRVEVQGTEYVALAAPLVGATSTDSIVLQSARTARVHTGQEFTIDAGDDVLVQSDRDMAFAAGTGMAFSSDRGVSVSASDSLILMTTDGMRLQAGQGCVLDASSNVELTAGAECNVHATTGLNLTTDANALLDANWNTTTHAGATMYVQGALVEIN